MSQNMNTTNIDMSLFDRQVRTYGMDAIKKLTNSSVLIIGLANGLGTEVGKNLALGGIKNIYLYDNTPILRSDLETGFYYSEETINKSRNTILAPKLQELNPYITVLPVNNINQNQNVTIIINQNIDFVKEISRFCRNNNSKLVVLYSKGVSGIVFVDAGESHTINDITGEIIDPVQIAEIKSDGKVLCAKYSSHDYQTGDYITFDNLQGDNVDFLKKEWKIKVHTNTLFELQDFKENNFKFINGTAIHIKKPITIKHSTFESQINNPTLGFSFDTDYSRKLVDTYLKFYDGDFTDTLLQEHYKLFSYELIPVVSLMGSITASEAIKLITNKYMPVNQWFTWSDNTLLPTNNIDIEAKTTYGLLYGRDFEEKLFNTNWFMVGSGAIGCEHLKNLAFMNVGNSRYGSGQIIITDPDSIEKSNLNRQFLFRSEHIGKPKSEMASLAIKKLQPNINITALTQKVGSDNLDFTNKLFGNKNITGVLNALDNIKARRFMDEQCFNFGLPLFESGTTATKGNTQPVIPFITETYSASNDPEQEKTYPACTIKSFPNEIHHTIHWAMDQFEFFNRAPATMNNWLKNPNYLDTLGQNEKTIAMEDIDNLTIKFPTQLGLSECVKWAIFMFNENYNNNILKLLETFPSNHLSEDGTPFWSSGKRCPTPITFDINNSLHLDYIESTTHLLARISGLTDNFTREDLISLLNNKSYPINKQDFTFEPIYISQEFEKDDDTNWHIDWITASSNMRALNYGIPLADKQQTKGISGKIIPAIATTTSAVSGLILLEMMKYLLGFNKIDNYRNTFINLAEPVLIYSEPINAPMIDICGLKFNSWTKFEYTNDTTLAQVKEYYEKLFKTTITMMVVDTNMIYSELFGEYDMTKRMSQIIYDIYDTNHNLQNVMVSLVSDNSNLTLPVITVNLNKTQYSFMDC
jgi:ubiquitin-activating enzyme E1